MRAVALALGCFVVAATALPLVFPRVGAWQVRIFDFPRVQLAAVGTAACLLALVPDGRLSWPWALLPAITAIAVLHQLGRIWRYSPLAPIEVERSGRGDRAGRISLVVCNVLQDNRDAERLVRVIQEADPDVIVCMETDEWWRERLDVLGGTHRHAVRCPMPNTYGMCLYSRLPLERARVDFLIADEIPSIQTIVRLRSGAPVSLNIVHPEPPAPGESDSSAERDAELVVVARRVEDAGTPVIVCGDLNDVAWSRTTRLFQKISGLVDPRKGRGYYATFHARYPLLRYPLDHVFHSPDFRLSGMRRLDYVGSDHFPLFIELSHEPDAEAVQEAPAAGRADAEEGREVVALAQRRQSPSSPDEEA